jgi:hypothetical protein
MYRSFLSGYRTLFILSINYFYHCEQVSESLARTVSLPSLSKIPTAEVLESFNKYREDSYKGQVEVSVKFGLSILS